MNAAERHYYLRTLAFLYAEGGYATLDELKTFSGVSRHMWKTFSSKLAKLLQNTSRGWTHQRVLDELRKAKEFKRNRSVAGAKGAAVRWGNRDGSAIARPPNENGTANAVALRSHSSNPLTTHPSLENTNPLTTPRERAREGSPLTTQGIEDARDVAGGYDLHWLEQQWIEWRKGKAPLANPDRAFRGFVKRHVKENGPAR